MLCVQGSRPLKFIIPTLLPLILVSMATGSHAQEAMTVEQLLSAGHSENTALAAAMYITGWKEGTSIQLTFEAYSLRAKGSPAALESAARIQALSDCLMLLEVADLVAGLNAAMRENTIAREMPARSALRVAMHGVCPGPPGQDH